MSEAVKMRESAETPARGAQSRRAGVLPYQAMLAMIEAGQIERQGDGEDRALPDA
jgi:hypothetical protein